MIITEISEIELSVHSAGMYMYLNLSASVMVTLQCWVHCFLSWTVPDINHVFASSQNQLLSQVWRGPGVPNVKKTEECVCELSRI